jgi:hypothetical protein
LSTLTGKGRCNVTPALNNKLLSAGSLKMDMTIVCEGFQENAVK